MKLIFSILVFFISLIFYGQEIKVVNEYYEPLEGVEIYSSNKKTRVKTSYKGVATLANFSSNDTIIFFKEGYDFYTNTLDQLLVNGYWVKLTLSDYTLPSFVASTLREKKYVLSDQSLDKESILEEELIESNAQTSADILKLASGIIIQKSQGGGGSPIIRGFEANRVLLVIDGVRMNNAIYRSGHLQNSITLDNNILSQVDVQYGPGSVIYGSDAIGGVVHYRTKNPIITTADTLEFSGSFLTRHNTANKELTNHLDFSFGNKNFGSLTSFTYSKFGDIKMGENRFHGYNDWGYKNFYVQTNNEGVDSMMVNSDSSVQIGTAFNQYHLLQKFAYKLNENALFKSNTQFSSSSNINRYDRLNNINELGAAQYSEWYYGPQDRFLTSLTGEFSNYNTFYDRAIIIASYQNIGEDRITRPFKSLNRSVRKENVSIYSLNIDFVKALDSTSRLYYGGEFTHNNVISNAYEENILSFQRSLESTRYPDGGSSMATGALYIKYQKKINHFLVQTGIRYNHVLLNAKFKDTTFIKLPFNSINNSNGSLSGSLKVSYTPTKQTNLNATLSTGFRSPNIDDFGKVFKKDYYVVVPNNKLKPEQAYSADIGFVQVINNKKASKLLVIKGAIYGTYLDNAIIRTDYTLNGNDSIVFDGVLCKIRTNSNAESAFVYGATGDLKLHFNKFISFSSSINYTLGEIENSIDPLGHIPPFFGRSKLVFERKKWDFELFSEYNGWKRASDYASGSIDNLTEATTDGNPSWLTLNLRIGIELHQLAQIQLAAYNLMDVHYKSFSSGISAPGRSFMISLRAVF
jgi:hemoglobin/transferrin/lactoferrin receptor protein